MISKIGMLGFAAFLTMAACGGGGGGADNVDADPQPVTGTNGLNFGLAGQDVTTTEDVAITTPAASFQAASGTSTEDVTITLADGFFDATSTERNATVSLFGEIVQVSGGEGTLGNGQTVRLIFDETSIGTYSAALSLVSYGSLEPGITNPIDGEQFAVFGFETNPEDVNDVLPGTLGVTEYNGGFTASGIVRDDGGNIVGDRGTEFDGAITFEVDFNNSRANGQIIGSYETGGNDVPLTLNMAFGNIDDGAFTRILTCPSCNANTSSVTATFFGPAAEEIGGVVTMDATSDVDGSDVQFTGVGGFVLSR